MVIYELNYAITIAIFVCHIALRVIPRGNHGWRFAARCKLIGSSHEYRIGVHLDANDSESSSSSESNSDAAEIVVGTKCDKTYKWMYKSQHIFFFHRFILTGTNFWTFLRSYDIRNYIRCVQLCVQERIKADGLVFWKVHVFEISKKYKKCKNV